MTRRIFRNILLTAVLALLLTSVLLTGALYHVHEGRISTELHTEAEYLARALDLLPDDLGYLTSLEPSSRITLIAPDGQVLYDSTADISSMASHAQRPEVLQAMASGSGESARYSDTLSEQTLYYACRTADGHVLRIANTRSSVLGIFLNVAPQIALVLLTVTVVSLLIARHAARQIVSPINELNLDTPLSNDVYDELTPLLTRMDKQHEQILRHMRDLARAHSELTAIIASMREGLVLLDQTGTVLSINASAAAVFAVADGQAQGRELSALCHDAPVLEIVSSAQEGFSGDTLLRRGKHIYQIFASPVHRNGRVRGVVLMALDISARYAAEASRREFTANVSHELKTPLTSISGYAEIIESGIAKAEDVPLFAGKIRAEAKRLVALVNDILALSRLDEKQGLGNREPVALLPMLTALTEAFTPMAQEKGLTLRLQGCDATVAGYPVLLHELFRNLIDNAVKYTPAGGQVTITLSQESGRALCCVADTGVGIPAEHQPHVFERFYRVDKSHSRQTGGTGLGLAIVKHAAEIHHAELTLESQPGQGTRVSVAMEQKAI